MNTPLKLLSPKIPVTYSFHRSVLVHNLGVCQEHLTELTTPSPLKQCLHLASRTHPFLVFLLPTGHSFSVSSAGLSSLSLRNLGGPLGFLLGPLLFLAHSLGDLTQLHGLKYYLQAAKCVSPAQTSLLNSRPLSNWLPDV